jgi:anti-anti-sigma regulatory factor
MSTASAKMWVLAGEHFACLKISGRANFSSSIDFKTVVQELRQKGCTYFVLDLSECILMDSTFLGVLAGLGLKTTAGKSGEATGTIELLNANERIVELLESLGVLHLFKLAQGPLQMPPDVTEAKPLTSCCPDKQEVTRACLEAHQTLMRLSPENAAKFKEVAAFLAEDLKKGKSNT